LLSKLNIELPERQIRARLQEIGGTERKTLSLAEFYTVLRSVRTPPELLQLFKR
jgi:hypothetical protein